MTKSASKTAARKTREPTRKTASKGRGKTGNKSYRTAAKLSAQTVRNTRRESVAQFERFDARQVPDSLRALAERNVAQTRELYERSKDTVQAIFESWQKSFGAAGQGAAVVNRRFIDLAERNINTGFDLASGLVGARNLAEVMELQAAYWRKLFGEVQAHQGGRALLSTVRAEPVSSKSVEK
jgi:hypothetical protein